MKSIVFVTLLGIDSCTGNPAHSYMSYEVLTREECLSLVEDYSKLPFVESARCETTYTGE